MKKQKRSTAEDDGDNPEFEDDVGNSTLE
ncbi:unnamed protein product, partial [Didymodactylos carnosus]